MKTDYRINPNGFTLLELLIAMSIFSIGILGVASMQISGTGGNTVARLSTESSEYAQGQIELLMSIPYTSVTSGSSTTADGYTITWNVGSVTSPNGVSVQVTVRDPRGTERSRLNFRRFPDS